jgi:hypothetical protein
MEGLLGVSSPKNIEQMALGRVRMSAGCSISQGFSVFHLPFEQTIILFSLLYQISIEQGKERDQRP